MSLWQVLTNKYVLLLGVVYAGASATSNSLSLWMPQILKSFQLSNLETSLLGAIPYGLACVAMIIGVGAPTNPASVCGTPPFP